MPRNANLFGNRVFTGVIDRSRQGKMRALGGPSSNVTGVFIKSGHLDTEKTLEWHREEATNDEGDTSTSRGTPEATSSGQTGVEPIAPSPLPRGRSRSAPGVGTWAPDGATAGVCRSSGRGSRAGAQPGPAPSARGGRRPPGSRRPARTPRPGDGDGRSLREAAPALWGPAGRGRKWRFTTSSPSPAGAATGNQAMRPSLLQFGAQPLSRTCGK